MPVQTILRYPHPVLKKVCNKVEQIDQNIHDLIQDLVDTMHEGPGSVGVAASQIGVTLRICVVDVSRNRHGKDNNHGLLRMINPEITGRSGSATMREGCMSVPDYTGDVDRATVITLQFSEPDGTHRKVTASGFEAVAIQHEMDHLDGVLFLDRVTSIKTGLFRRKNYCIDRGELMSDLLTKKEQKLLLKIARDTIVDYVTSQKVPAVSTISPGLNLHSGCFVTVKQKGELRGCIGNFESEQPLYQLVQEMAVSAATRDPRFYPIKVDDLSDFKLDISVLSPLKKAESVEEIRVGVHGIYIVKGSYHGVLLPQVATEYGWNRDEFLQHTCIKAGLPKDAWQGECDIFIFSAQVFGEQ